MYLIYIEIHLCIFSLYVFCDVVHLDVLNSGVSFSSPICLNLLYLGFLVVVEVILGVDVPSLFRAHGFTFDSPCWEEYDDVCGM